MDVLSASISADLPGQRNANGGKSAPYLIAYRVEGKQKRAAVDRDLSDAAVWSGKAKIEWERGTYNNAELHRWFERAI